MREGGKSVSDQYEPLRSLPFPVLAGALSVDLGLYKARKHGSEYYGPCLIHRPKNNKTSFSYGSDGKSNCFSCGAKGRGAIDLFKLARGIGLQQAVEFLEGIKPPPNTKKEPVEAPIASGTAMKVSRALVSAYVEKTAVREGCVRHILSNDPGNPQGWQKTISPPGEYQNGGYWGTPAGWYVAAMSISNPRAAQNMARDYVRFLRTHVRAGGASEAWEWFNPDTGKNANPLYAATVALPYASLQQAGMLRRKPRD